MHHKLAQSNAPVGRRSLRSHFAPSLIAVAVMACAAPAVAGPLPAGLCTDTLSYTLPNATVTFAQPYTAGQVVSGNTVAPAGLCRVVRGPGVTGLHGSPT